MDGPGSEEGHAGRWARWVLDSGLFLEKISAMPTFMHHKPISKPSFQRCAFSKPLFPSSQNIALLGPTACLAAVSVADSADTSLVVPLITAALGLSSFSLAGLYCTHGDMSPKYAGEQAEDMRDAAVI